jgi:hypothetical protein
MGSIMAEQAFFNGGEITVTRTRFMVHGQTYAMQGVTSIRRVIEEPSKKGAIIAIVVGAIITLISFGVISDSLGGGFMTLLIGVGILAAGILWLRSLKDTFIVMLTSASGETRALSSPDEQFVSQIVAALNNALIARG